MPRTARKRSKSGLYRIELKGKPDEQIFRSMDAKWIALNILQSLREEHILLLGWCVLSNELIFLIKDTEERLSSLMQRMVLSLTIRLNRERKGRGQIFRDRFYSKVIEEEEIGSEIEDLHRLPVEKGLCRQEEDYPWSSFIYRLQRSRRLDFLTEETKPTFRSDSTPHIRIQ